MNWAGKSQFSSMKLTCKDQSLQVVFIKRIVDFETVVKANPLDVETLKKAVEDQGYEVK